MLIRCFIEVNTLVSSIQVSELETEFEKVKGEKVVPARYLKSQQQKQAKLAVEVAASGGDGEGEVVTDDTWKHTGDAVIHTAVFD